MAKANGEKAKAKGEAKAKAKRKRKRTPKANSHTPTGRLTSRGWYKCKTCKIDGLIEIWHLQTLRAPQGSQLPRDPRGSPGHLRELWGSPGFPGNPWEAWGSGPGIPGQPQGSSRIPTVPWETPGTLGYPGGPQGRVPWGTPYSHEWVAPEDGHNPS